MCKTFSSFEQLGSAMKDMTRVDAKLFEVLSDGSSQESARKRALNDLRSKVSSILKNLEANDYLFGTEDKSIYNDYCNLPYFFTSLIFPSVFSFCMAFCVVSFLQARGL